LLAATTPVATTAPTGSTSITTATSGFDASSTNSTQLVPQEGATNPSNDSGSNEEINLRQATTSAQGKVEEGEENELDDEDEEDEEEDIFVMAKAAKAKSATSSATSTPLPTPSAAVSTKPSEDKYAVKQQPLTAIDTSVAQETQNINLTQSATTLQKSITQQVFVFISVFRSTGKRNLTIGNI